MSTVYQFPLFDRLEPRTHQFNGGSIAHTDVLTLDKAAKCASKHAGTEINLDDFLLAAARGQIALRAIVHREARLQKYDGGIYCNQGESTENTVPKGAIPTLPLSACQQLANVGRASWRTFDGFEHQNGVLMRFTVATLLDNEPDFETVPTDCRVMGYDVHALADAFIDWPDVTSGASEKPLTTTERNTLLAIIAALCEHASIKPKDRGAAGQIARMTEDIGAPVSDDTVRRWLAKIPDALESRMK
ncbi:MAG: hypothetical protein NOF05_13710 [Candidatus Accumulibacter phosphatis]|nr:hypothetical protein [Candidatus Accumulibacter phosphatis]